MTRDQAVEKLQNGCKIVHENFMEGEYLALHLNSNEIRTEDNCDFTEQFWKNDFFNTGWSCLYESL